MVFVVSRDRKLTTHERAKVAARARWGDVRVVRLDNLEPSVAAVIRALVAAQKAADEAKADDPGQAA